ncbi:MAG: V-type ATPase subunit, partial [Oscillospiraceae bacterium]
EHTMADLDRACDNALMGYIKSARLVAFGEAHVIAYIIAFEAQLVAVRTVMMGRKVGLSEDKIEERLRESYV